MYLKTAVFLCWALTGRVSLRATCPQPSGSASRGWRWLESWWRGTSIKRGWWSCRRPSGGRRWYGRSLFIHASRLVCLALTEVCVLFDAERQERIQPWRRRKSPVSGSCKQQLLSSPQSLRYIGSCGLAFKLCFPPLILCPPFICFPSRM